MELSHRPDTDGLIHVRNVGGISETTVEFEPGVSVLVGRNATNRTSLLQAFMAVLGGDDISLKDDAEEERVEMTLGNETYSRGLRRSSGKIDKDGNPHLEDAELVNLFAFLLESNPVRQAVARGDALREIIMQPVDTDQIQVQIESLVDKRQRLKDELAEIEDPKADLPALE